MSVRKRITVTVALSFVLVSACSNRALAAADTVAAAAVTVTADSMEWVPYIAPNSEEETYLRYLQIAGVAPHYPWSSRGFSPREAKQLSVKLGIHPWTRSGTFTSVNPAARLLLLSAELRANSGFPYGSNDGPAWAGRGLTARAVLGLAFEAGPVSVVLAPTAFLTQNTAFDLVDNGQTGHLRFADARFPTTVDRPQRFGEQPYGRMDPGNSTLHANLAMFQLGVSTANMAWGPMELYPFVLGTNAPGFFHAFVATARPVYVGVGSLYGRVLWGQLAQSRFSAVTGGPTYVSPVEPGTRRFGSGLAAVFEPRGLTGLEVGVARFFHSPWPRDGIPRSYFVKPFENFLKKRLTGAPNFSDPSTSAENQVISAFFRWAFPRAGLEMYAEYGRDDHTWDKRDLIQEPDHSRSYGLGIRKSFSRGPERLDGITIEVVNFQLPHLARTGRGEGTVYRHEIMRQGHTHRGQLLGADAGVGAAAAATMRWDRYHPRGRSAFSIQRTVRQERGTFFADGAIDPRSSDVQYTVDALRTRMFTKVEMTGGLAVSYGFNRNFRGDGMNASALVGVRVPLQR